MPDGLRADRRADVSVRALEQAARRLKLDEHARRPAPADQAAAQPADLSRQAAGRLRRGGAGRGDRAPRPAAAGGARAERVRVRAPRDGRGDDPERRVQRALGDAAWRASSAIPTIGSSGRGSSSPAWARPGGRNATATRSATCRSAPRTREVGPPTQMAVFSAMRIDLPDPSLVVLIGASGSGKSSFAREHFARHGGDLLGLLPRPGRRRRERSGATADAFAVLHFIAARRLAQPRFTVIDATNVQREARRPLIELAKQHDLFPVAIVLDLPEAVCQERNRVAADRDFGPHVVPPAARAAAQVAARACSARASGACTCYARRRRSTRRGPARAAVDRPPRRARPVRHHRRRPRLPRRAG